MEETFYTTKTEYGVVNSSKTYKMIAMRGMVVFPGQSLHFDVVRDKSILALNKAVEENEDIFLVAQKRANTASPAPKDIYRVGTIAKIRQVLKLPNDTVRVLVSGLVRMEIESYVQIAPHFEVQLMPYAADFENSLALEAAKRTLKIEFDKYKKLDHKIPTDVMSALTVEEPEKFVTAIATYVYNTDAQKQTLLQEKTVTDQLINITKFFAQEADIMLVEKKIAQEVRQSIEKNQREYYLREQIVAIKKELGDEEEQDAFIKMADKKKLPSYVKDKIKKEAQRMEKMSPTSPEAGVSRSYIEWLLDLPWTELSEDNVDLKRAREILDEDHFGLEKVKDRIIEYLAVHQLTKTLKAPILCFVGPPGVGKTSIVSSIARAAGKRLVSMSLGGVRDEAEIRGHRRTYIGSMPGRIVSAMRNAEVVNPVFLLDEIDKMSSDFRGDPASAMLEVLDPNQNNSFKDHYIELPYDLSKVMFIMTANTIDTIAPPLLDRMEIIELSGYSYTEKMQIAKKYLLPKQINANGLLPEGLEITDEALMKIILEYTRESGVRNLEREIGTVARKIAVEVITGEDKGKYIVDKDDIEKYLGAPKYLEDVNGDKSEIGQATGLAWTSVGGTTLTIEVALLKNGKGDIQLTGSLGDVMKESCQTALSLVRSRADEYGISQDDFKKYDIHVHFPEGATPKDGPSAGITIATALISAFAHRPVRNDLAMTGEVTLRGKVLAIGGLKEKSLAALRYGVKKLIIPYDNKKDFDEIPSEVKDAIEIHYVSTVDEVFKEALE